MLAINFLPVQRDYYPSNTGMALDSVFERYCEFCDTLGELHHLRVHGCQRQIREMTALVNSLEQVLAITPYMAALRTFPWAPQPES